MIFAHEAQASKDFRFKDFFLQYYKVLFSQFTLNILFLLLFSLNSTSLPNYFLIHHLHLKVAKKLLNYYHHFNDLHQVDIFQIAILMILSFIRLIFYCRINIDIKFNFSIMLLYFLMFLILITVIISFLLFFMLFTFLN